MIQCAKKLESSNAYFISWWCSMMKLYRWMFRLLRRAYSSKYDHSSAKSETTFEWTRLVFTPIKILINEISYRFSLYFPSNTRKSRKFHRIAARHRMWNMLTAGRWCDMPWAEAMTSNVYHHWMHHIPNFPLRYQVLGHLEWVWSQRTPENAKYIRIEIITGFWN